MLFWEELQSIWKRNFSLCMVPQFDKQKKLGKKIKEKKIPGKKKTKKSKLKMYRATLFFVGALCEDVWLQLVQFWRTFWDFS